MLCGSRLDQTSGQNVILNVSQSATVRSLSRIQQEEGGDGTVVRAEWAQSIMSGNIHNGTLAAAGVLRRGEEIWKGVDDGKTQKANGEMGSVGGKGRAGRSHAGCAGAAGSGG